MSTYVISYDLKNRTSSTYSDLHDEIEAQGDSIDPLESTWMVDTSKSVKTVKENLKEVLECESGDRVLINEITNSSDHSWYLDTDDSQWLKDRL